MDRFGSSLGGDIGSITTSPQKELHCKTDPPLTSNVALEGDLQFHSEKGLGNENESSPHMSTHNQPFLHPLKAFQLTKEQKGSEDVKLEISPAGLEKEEQGSLSGVSVGKHDVEESSSACSGSLLGNLGDDDDDETAPRVRSGGRRRTRHREVRKQMQREDDDPPFPPSPAGSQSSSLDGVYPGERTSHPFRVVEHDTASVYSSVSLGKVGKILAGMEALTIQEGQLTPTAESFPENKPINHLKSVPSKDIISAGKLSNTGDFGGITMSPEPDLVASTKSSSGSDKSNSLPRGAQEPLPAVVSSVDPTLQQLQLSIAENAASQQLPHTEPSKSPYPKEGSPARLLSHPSTTAHNQPIDNQQIFVRGNIPLSIHSPSFIGQDQHYVSPSQHSTSSGIPSSGIVPVAPPRRRRRNRRNTDDDTSSVASVSSLPSPALTIGAVDAISIGQSLDLRQAIRGDYLVKPQDSENAKAVGPSAEEIARIEAEDTTSQASTPEVSRAPSRLADDSTQPQSPDGVPGTPGTPGSTIVETPTKGVMVYYGVHTFKYETLKKKKNNHPLSWPGNLSQPSSPSCSFKSFPVCLSSRHRSFCAPKSDVLTSPTSIAEGQMKQLNMMVRTRSDSGKELTDAEWFLPSPVDLDAYISDKEILQQVTVLNLDTGERIPLSDAENCLPQALNPLSLHIMRLTSEYVSNSNIDGQESDEESVLDVNVKKLPEVDGSAVKKKTPLKKRIRYRSQLKKFLGRKMESAVSKARSLAHEVSHRHREEKDVFEDDAPAHDTMQYVKIKTAHSHKGPHEFDNLMYVQEITGEHTGPIWCMKFSGCGRLLATAGQDHVLRVWVLKQAFNYFLDIRTKCNADIKVSPTPSQESLVSQHSGQSGEDLGSLDPNDDGSAPFMPKPFCVYTGHTADMLDISWSKNYFLLTSSMDKTVRLWHISRKECLCIFQHMDFVTAITFHPKDDRYFISGALDGKLRLWSIPDKRVVLWNEVEGQANLITAANFCQNGKFTVVGTYDGRCIFYETEQLKYFTQINVRSTRGKNAKGRKITGIEPLPGEDKVLVTSNDSRIRLYDLRDLNLSCKYKGYSNMSSQIRAGFSHDGKFIVAGSENQCIYIWKTHHDYSKFSSARRDRNYYWEGVKAHSAVVTCAVFAPHPELVFNFIEQQQEHLNKTSEQQEQQNEPNPSSQNKDSGTTNKGYVLVSADFSGCIKVFLKKEKPKHSSLPASALV
ncbi:WD repeat-containing protein 44 isoform X3 [Palaemon carinicauda]|uniref:WD repeat-containing protein 44 isoform X3 n=1 Tax=Palaemon carinicauda TaxID=392227 RepID=UPI0035B63DF2